jgi:DNA-binding CsgD family transcriptional regulator
MLSYIHATSGELAAAEALLDEIRAASEATGTPAQLHAALWIAALRGREADTRELIRTVRDEAAIRGEGYAVFVIEHVTAVLHNGFGRYGEALDALRRQAVDASHRDNSPRPMAELIEAAVRAGEPELARLALGRLAETTGATGTHWALGIEARSRALLSEGEEAESLYREAIDLLGRTSIGLQVARSHLVYGEWLQDQRRSRDARDQLRTAYELLSGYGVAAFAERARLALQSAGGSAGRPRRDAPDPLTAQEAQIARLAAEGHTNREIGARLFISASTVEYHLGKVFRKLDVKSRLQLSQRLS